MAKVNLDLPIKGSFGNVSIYMLNGKMVLRNKGGASATRIKNEPEFAKLRKQMSRFGGCSTTAKMIRDAMPSIKPLAHPAFHGDLVNLCTSVMDLNPVNPADGKKSIIFSYGLPLLQGFAMNVENTFDAVITTPVGCQLNREQHSAIVQLPPLLPGKNFRIPWTYPYYRLRVNLGIIRDMVFDGLAYVPVTPDLKEYSEKYDTDWWHVRDTFPSTEISLQLQNPVFDENCYLMVTIGVEFGVQKNGEISNVKHAGCGKILTVQ